VVSPSPSLFFNLLSFASSGLATLLSLGLVVVGLVHVRRANPIAGLLLAGAGALGAFGSLIRRLVSLAFSFTSGTPLFTISQILTTGLSILSGLLIPVAIFMLANSIKQNQRSGS
jgi:hypothetical protein